MSKRDQPPSDVCIVSYGIVRITALLKARTWNVVIVDESQNIKEPTSQQTRAVLPLCRAAKHCLLLSGTPQVAHPYELYPQLLAVAGDVIGTWWTFTERFCQGHMNSRREYEYRGIGNVAELRDLMQPHVIRILKADVLSLPPKHRHVIELAMSDADVQHFRSMRGKLMRNLRADEVSQVHDSAAQGRGQFLCHAPAKVFHHRVCQ